MSDKKTCFIISPIGAELSETRQKADLVLRDFLIPAATACGYDPKRADEFYSPGGTILDKIIHDLIDADIVIADLAGGAGNVLYEVALRQVVRKPIVLTCSDGSPPSDILGFECVRLDGGDMSRAAASRSRLIDAIRVATKSPVPETAISQIVLPYLESQRDPSVARYRMLADRVEQLSRDVKDWTNRAIETVLAADSPNTVFQMRKDHFAQEKHYLAEAFFPLLLERCKALAYRYEEVLILVDSGTTVFPFFERFGRGSRAEPTSIWTKRVRLVTNNIPGVTSLMRVARSNENNAYSPLTIQCRLLPGVPLPVYEAVVGRETEEALARNLSSPNSKRRVIALVTGNWVRIDSNLAPVLLARGTGHREIKQALIANSDEVYIVAPLGKILFKVPVGVVNRALGYAPPGVDSYAPDPAWEAYSDVLGAESCRDRIRFVSTLRPGDEFVLSPLSQALRTAYNLKLPPSAKAFAQMKMEEIPHLFFGFDAVPKDRDAQMRAEFPHDLTRVEPFERLFLHPEMNESLKDPEDE